MRLRLFANIYLLHYSIYCLRLMSVSIVSSFLPSVPLAHLRLEAKHQVFRHWGLTNKSSRSWEPCHRDARLPRREYTVTRIWLLLGGLRHWQWLSRFPRWGPPERRSSRSAVQPGLSWGVDTHCSNTETQSPRRTWFWQYCVPPWTKLPSKSVPPFASAVLGPHPPGGVQVFSERERCCGRRLGRVVGPRKRRLCRSLRAQPQFRRSDPPLWWRDCKQWLAATDWGVIHQD